MLLLVLGIAGPVVAIKNDKLAHRRQKVSEFYEKHLLAAARPRGEGGGRDITLKEALDQVRSHVSAAFPDQLEDEAAVCTVLGKTYFTLAEYGPAEDLLRRAEKLRRDVLGESHPDTVRSWISLTDVLMETNRSAEAMAPLRRFLPIIAQSAGMEDPLTLAVRKNLILAMYLGDEEADFIALWDDLLRAQRRVLGEGHEDTMMTRNNLGWTLLNKQERAAPRPMKSLLLS